MHPVLDELLTLLRPTQTEPHAFLGQSQDLGWGAIFGGQVIAQALSAAAQTLPADRVVHSLHSYFLRSGDAREPVRYEVEATRDGHSFATRRVRALQKGAAIFSMEASFQVQEPGFEHQDPMPEATPPEALRSEVELARALGDRIPAPLRAMATAERPIEVRQVQPLNALRPEARPPQRLVWFRAIDALPEDPALHRYLLAYASDFHFLGAALQPHAVSWLTPGMQVASLDHAMWFHRPFRMDDWLLYAIDSPSASGGRGLVRGRFFTREGVLVASAAQEGLMRDRLWGQRG